MDAEAAAGVDEAGSLLEEDRHGRGETGRRVVVGGERAELAGGEAAGGVGVLGEQRLERQVRVGRDGAVQALLDAYDEVNKTTPIASTRPASTPVNLGSGTAADVYANSGTTVTDDDASS